MIHMRAVWNKTAAMAASSSVAALLAVLPFEAAAQPAGDPDAGHQIAQTWCSSCHVIGPEQQRATSTGAPPFTAVANAKTTTSLGLHAFFQSPHQRMPDLHLSRSEMDDVVAYILSLRS